MTVVLLFANPIAGRGRGESIARRISQALTQRGMEVRHFQQKPSLLSDADLRAESAEQLAIVIGGDGTLRAAAERMFQFVGGDADKIPPILFIPLGTANLMAQHLALRWDTRHLEAQVLEALDRRQIARLDIGQANDRLFLLMVGVGIDAAVVHELDRLRTGPIDLTSYALPAALALQKYDYPPLSVEIDGRWVVKNQPAMVFVGNAREYGTSFPILIDAQSDDGLLDLCVLPCRSRMEIVRLLMGVVAGEHAAMEGVVYIKGRSMRVISDQAVPVQIDGEASGHTPLSIELLPSRLRFIVQ